MSPLASPPLAFSTIAPREAVLRLQASRIREVANSGIGRTDVLPFWFGEPDLATPQFIRDAAVAALAAGDVFYTSNLGILPLREAIAGYLSRLHPARGAIGAERVAVTSSGVSALMIAAQTLMGADDRVVIVTPVWPNLTEAPRILGADVVCVPLDCNEGAWSLDTSKLVDALVPGTKALVLNSPNNPSGWVIAREQQEAILDHCRRLGIWIVADDVYERIVFDDETAPDRGLRCAPSFLDLAEPGDRLIVANSFSKSWLMTGWRLGWLVSPQGRDGATLIDHFGKLIEYNSSCAPGFVQRAGIAAIEFGEPVIAASVARYQAARDHLCARLQILAQRHPGMAVARPAGAMYVFFELALPGLDSLTLCKRLVAEAGLGLAPGAAFSGGVSGGACEGYLRWCIASSIERIDDGVERLTRFLSNG